MPTGSPDARGPTPLGAGPGMAAAASGRPDFLRLAARRAAGAAQIAAGARRWAGAGEGRAQAAAQNIFHFNISFVQDKILRFWH